MSFLRVEDLDGNLIEPDSSYDLKKGWRLMQRVNRFGALREGNKAQRRLFGSLNCNTIHGIFHAESSYYDDAGWISLQSSLHFPVRIPANILEGLKAVIRGDYKTALSNLNNIHIVTGIYIPPGSQVNLTCPTSPVGCTMKGVTIFGKIAPLSFRNCSLEDASFEGAEVRDSSRCALDLVHCHLRGAKYLTRNSLDQYGLEQVNEGRTYDVLEALPPTNSNGYTVIMGKSVMKGAKKHSLLTDGRGVAGGTSRPTAASIDAFLNQGVVEEDYVPVAGPRAKESLIPARGHMIFNYRQWPVSNLRQCFLSDTWSTSQYAQNYVVDARIFEYIPKFGQEYVTPPNTIPREYRTDDEGFVQLMTSTICVNNRLWRDLLIQCAQSGLGTCEEFVVPSDNGEDIIKELAVEKMIHQYSYKPSPLVHLGAGETLNRVAADNTLTLGFELEVEFSRKKKPAQGTPEWNLYENESYALFNPTAKKITEDKFLYCKRDGSLDYGMEVVSHPFTWKWWRENRDTKIKQTLETLRKDGFVSHDPGTCGLHVHMAKGAFKTGMVWNDNGTRRSIANVHLMRFAALIYRNKNFMVWLSRREEENPEYAMVNVWRKGRDGNKLIKNLAYNAEGPGRGERRMAVNTQPTFTNEVRIFRGTLKFESFCSSIELCHALWAYTAEPTNPLNVMSFVEWVKKCYWWQGKERHREYPYLAELLRTRQDEMLRTLDNKNVVFSDDSWLTPKKSKEGVACVSQ